MDVVSCQMTEQLSCWQQRSNVSISETVIRTSMPRCWMNYSEITGQCFCIPY